MKKPLNLDANLKKGDNKQSFNIKFNDDSTHEEVVYQFIEGLVDKGFASEREVIQGIVDITEWELKKMEGN